MCMRVCACVCVYVDNVWCVKSYLFVFCILLIHRQKAKRRVLADSSTVVCQSLRIAVKRELIHLPLRKDSTKINSKSIKTESKDHNPLPDSSSDSPVDSLTVSIPHSTSSVNGNPLITIDQIDQQVTSNNKRVSPDSTTVIPLCLPSALSTNSDTSAIIDSVKTSNGCFGDVSTTTGTTQDLLATPPRIHSSVSPDHKRIRRSPRNLTLVTTQHVISLKPESHDIDEAGSEMITCALCKICVHKCECCVCLYLPSGPEQF